MLKAVLFDLDDTLYRERDFVDQSFRSVAKAMEGYLSARRKPGQSPSGESAEELFGQMIELMEQEGRGEIFDRLCERHDVDIPVQELVKI